MSIYVMSDIHGKYDEYLEMLEKINFSDEDTLYILGDVIDRGEHPIKVLQHALSKKNIILLMGNHEKLMLDSANINRKISDDAIIMWHFNGGETTIEEYSQQEKTERQRLLDEIIGLKWHQFVEMSGKKFFLSHAAVLMDDNEEFEDALIRALKTENILWNRDNLLYCENKSDYIFIHGHTPTGTWHPNGIYEIYSYDNGRKINIDCGAGYNKRLGCLRLDDMAEFYVDCGDEREMILER